MHSLQGVGRFFVGMLLSGLLLALPILFVVQSLIGSPEPIKRSLQKSGVYDDVVSTALDQATSKADQQAQEFLQDQGVVDAIRGAFPPSILQAQSEQAIDAVFAWLSGETEQLNISPDLSDAQARLVANLTTYAKTRSEKLPRCTPRQTASLPQDQNILTLPCLPAGITPDAVAAQFAQQTSDAIKLPNGQEMNVPTNSTAQQIRDAFQLIDTYLWALVVVTLLTAVGYLFLYRPRREGIRRLGSILLTSGISLGITVALFIILSQRAFTMVGQGSGPAAALQEGVLNAIRELLGSVPTFLGIWAGAYAVLGVAGIIIGRHKNRQPLASEQKTNPRQTLGN